MAPLTDLPAYLDRLGLRPGAGLDEIHRAHATTIAFENLDSYAGRPVPLDPAHLEDKMVGGRRGGYCFEHNLLLASALESLGIPVEPLLARVRMGPPEAPRPLNHLLLRVVREGRPWLADVGFGGGGLLDPLPMTLGAETVQSGWTYRLAEDGPEWVLQVFVDGDWTDLYGFVPEAVRPVDIEVSNWFVATHPDSPFVTGLMFGARSPDRCLSLFVSQQAVLIERPVGQASTLTAVELAEVPDLLAGRFGVDGVRVSSDGRLVG